MFGKTQPAKTPGAAIAFLSGKKYKPTDKTMADDGDTSDEGHPGLGVASRVAPARQSPTGVSQDPMADEGAEDGDLKSQIDSLIDQYGVQAVQDQIDACVQEEQDGTETDTDSGMDMGAADPMQG